MQRRTFLTGLAASLVPHGKILPNAPTSTAAKAAAANGLNPVSTSQTVLSKLLGVRNIVVGASDKYKPRTDWISQYQDAYTTACVIDKLRVESEVDSEFDFQALLANIHTPADLHKITPLVKENIISTKEIPEPLFKLLSDKHAEADFEQLQNLLKWVPNLPEAHTINDVINALQDSLPRYFEMLEPLDRDLNQTLLRNLARIIARNHSATFENFVENCPDWLRPSINRIHTYIDTYNKNQSAVQNESRLNDQPKSTIYPQHLDHYQLYDPMHKDGLANSAGRNCHVGKHNIL